MTAPHAMARRPYRRLEVVSRLAPLLIDDGPCHVHSHLTPSRRAAAPSRRAAAAPADAAPPTTTLMVAVRSCATNAVPGARRHILRRRALPPRTRCTSAAV